MKAAKAIALAFVIAGITGLVSASDNYAAPKDTPVEKQQVVKAQASARIIVDSAVVNADWDDIQRGIYVGVSTIPDDGPIALDRSFKLEILTNTDQEELARSGPQ